MTDLIARARRAASAKSAAIQAAADEIDAIRKDILAGQTTGDPVQDYVLFRFGEEGGDALARLRSVNESLAGKTGELILVDYTRKERMRHGGCFGGGGSASDWNTAERACLAILEGEALVIERGEKSLTCRLPFERYLWNESPGLEPIAERIAEQEPLGPGDYTSRDFWMANGQFQAYERQFLLTVGDGPVRERLDRRSLTYPWKPEGKPDEFRLALEKLGHLTLIAEE